MKTYNTYHFFYGGPFSQWARSKFVIDSIEFTHAEQYMMYKKALVFDDLQAALNVLQSKDPAEQKAIGRAVENFVPKVWNSVSRDVVYRANIAKFTQNPDFYQSLIATRGLLLVEASPTDKIWGIGLSEYDAQGTGPADWRGTNWLGQVITEVREHLIGE